MPLGAALLSAAAVAGGLFGWDCLFPDVGCREDLSESADAESGWMRWELVFRSSRSPQSKKSFSRRERRACSEARRLKKGGGR